MHLQSITTQITLLGWYFVCPQSFQGMLLCCFLLSSGGMPEKGATWEPELWPGLLHQLTLLHQALKEKGVASSLVS